MLINFTLFHLTFLYIYSWSFFCCISWQLFAKDNAVQRRNSQKHCGNGRNRCVDHSRYVWIPNLSDFAPYTWIPAWNVREESPMASVKSFFSSSNTGSQMQRLHLWAVFCPLSDHLPKPAQECNNCICEPVSVLCLIVVQHRLRDAETVSVSRCLSFVWLLSDIGSWMQQLHL